MGDIYRDGESTSDFGALPTYGFGMAALDDVVKKHQPDGSKKIFTLDAQKHCNELAFLNDPTIDSLADEEQQDQGSREANAEFVEVLIDGWPHIFVVAKESGINAFSEGLISYGNKYWEHHRNHRFKMELEAKCGLARVRMFDSSPQGTFASTPLAPGQLEKLKWSDSSKTSPGDIVSPNAYRLGVDKSTTETLLDFCNETGIISRARRITIGGGTLDCGTEEGVTLGGEKWIIQRHSSHSQSNLQWISPADDNANNDFLRVLGAAGFDDLLHSIGTKLGWKTAAVYQASFICVSFCRDGRLHYDVSGSGGRALNIIVPLILANESEGPELEVRPSNDKSYPPTVGDYKYTLDSAILLGDDAEHATGRVDYTATREFRMAASIYIADICEENVTSLKDSYTQLYRPGNGDVLSLAGAHWRKEGGVSLQNGVNTAALTSATKSSKKTHKKQKVIRKESATKKRPTLKGIPEAKEVWSGVPDEEIHGGWPASWTKKTFERMSGKTKGSHDSYWYSPIEKKKLRSMNEVKQFIAAVETANGDEKRAWNIFKGKTR